MSQQTAIRLRHGLCEDFFEGAELREIVVKETSEMIEGGHRPKQICGLTPTRSYSVQSVRAERGRGHCRLSNRREPSAPPAQFRRQFFRHVRGACRLIGGPFQKRRPGRKVR